MTSTCYLLRVYPILAFLAQAPAHLSFAFVPQREKQPHQTSMFGLADWRGRVHQGGELSPTGGRPILILPFEAEDALLPGQSRDLVLKEGRLFDLVQDSMDDHDSVIGAALLGEDGFLDVMTLCEIHNFDVHSGYRGKVTVSVTLRALGRAEMTQLTEIKPIMNGYCKELQDEEKCDLDMACGIVDDIEAIIEDLSRRKDWSDQRRLYDEAYTLLIQSVIYPSDIDESLRKVFAASWAAFSVVRNKAILLEAMKISDLVERLQFGLKAVLAEKYQMAPIANSNNADTGFR